MAQLAPMMQLRPRFEDKCGHPLAGGNVFAFEAGTSNPKATYADAEGTIPNTHPIKLDYRGEADIFLLSGRYRFVVYSCTGVKIYDVDDVGEWLGLVNADRVMDGDKSQHQINIEQAEKNLELSEEIVSSVQTERDRALLAESNLQTNIGNESTRATDAEANLSLKIDGETSRAQAAEQSLQVQITTGNAGIKYFSTEAQLLAFVPGTTDPKQAYAFDTKKNYLWVLKSGSTTEYEWRDEGKSPLDLANQYTDDHVKPLKKLVGEAESELLEAAVDQDGFAYRTTDANGNVQFAGKKLGFNESSIEEITNNAPFLVLDKDEKVVLYIDEESNLHVPNGIFYGGGSLDENLRNVANDISSEKIYRKIAGQTYQNAVISRQQHMSQFTSIMTLAESNGLRNRMIAGVKISTGLFVVWHQQTKSQYDGDGSGSAFWSAFIDIDENLQVTVRDKKLFIYPDTDAGIIKHPHLGRTNDNRLIMVYEKSVGYAEATPQNPVDYIKYVVYSADEGVTWTSPIQLKYINSPPTTQLKALGTTCEVLKLKSGRLIVALYSTLGHSGCIYSDDDGLNWVYSDKFINESNWGFEPSICPDSDGHLVMVMRPKANTNLHAGFAKSKDNGLSWEMMHSNRVVSVTNQSFLLYDEVFGVHLYSHDVNELNRRTNYRISISYDDCNTFPLTYAPFLDSRYVGYTQLMKWSDGIYLLLMEYNDVWQGINSNEQLGIQIINAKEVFNNVTRPKI